MRYTKRALLIFGAGLLSGIVVIAARLPRWGWVASATMALGIVCVPIGIIADLRHRPPKPKAKPARTRVKAKPNASRPRAKATRRPSRTRRRP
jgi:hypothetical protein